ncbi:MAG: helicase, partial [bacterium]
MNTDLSFITNEKNQSLKKRFEVLIKDSSFFDCLVGYFYSSGFHALFKSLENTEKIRILIGISTSRQTFDLMEKANEAEQQAFDFSHAEAKKEVENLVLGELENSEDNS